jgi:NADH-quinone oxidoreductase subunit M
MLWMFQRVMFGELTKPENRVLKDLSKREVFVLSCVTLFIFWIGIYPQTFLSRMEPTVKAYLTQVQQKYQAGIQLQEGEKIKLAQVEKK